jgi:hypothetical protein
MSPAVAGDADNADGVVVLGHGELNLESWAAVILGAVLKAFT